MSIPNLSSFHQFPANDANGNKKVKFVVTLHDVDVIMKIYHPLING